MDGSHFDTLTRAMIGSRRRALRIAVGGALSAALEASSGDDAAARKKKACPPCKKRKKGKCKKNRPDGTGCAGGTCQSGRCVTPAPLPPQGPTCIMDGVRNGSESGVDCGGGCGRCANGQTCTNRNDCETATCGSSGVCESCTGFFTTCDTDTNGSNCICHQPTNGGGNSYCLRGAAESFHASCFPNPCAEGSFCAQTGPSTFGCYKRCGAP